MRIKPFLMIATLISIILVAVDTVAAKVVSSTPTILLIQAQSETNVWVVVLVVLLALVMGPGVIWFLIYINLSLWIDARFNGVRISWFQLFRLRFKGVDVKQVVELMIKSKNAGLLLHSDDLAELFLAGIPLTKVVNPLIAAENAGLGLTLNQLKEHQLSGGDIEKVVKAMIAAKNADRGLDSEHKLNLDFGLACNIDLSGLDVVKAVVESTHHQVIATERFDAVARDGVELSMIARVTIRRNLHNILQGSAEDTVLARIHEGIATEIGLTKSHYEILESPYILADKVEQKSELFEDTEYFVESIDVVHIKIGKDIHAELDEERAKAKILTEKAREQEEKARAQAARARVIEAEIEVQKAMAAAFLDGNFSIEEYKRMKNLDADTDMRSTFSEKNRKYNDTSDNRDDS